MARILGRAKLADAAADFIAVEMRVAAVKERCKGAVVEAQQRRERAFGRAISVPSARQRTHASDQSAAKESNDIDLMCALTEHHPAAALGDQLLRSPGAVQKIGVVLGVDHAHRSDRPAGDDFTGAQDRAIETVAVSDDHLHARAPCLQRAPRAVRGAVQLHLPRVGRRGPREDAHQGALAGAVLTDERAHLAGSHLQIHPVQGDGGPEGLPDAAHPEARR